MEGENEYHEEQFFNKNSYKSFAEKHDLKIFDDENYINTDLHKELIVMPDDKRITSEIMSLAEYTRVISERASQIENGAPIFVDVKNETNPIKIAEMEIA
jgi:DNA-directed RNA polymerase subunit K/omega